MEGKLREEIRLGMSVMDLFMVISEGNPGAMNVMARLLESDEVSGFVTLLALDDMNIRGTQLWLAYNDFCQGDLGKLHDVAEQRDYELVKFLNTEGMKGNHPYKAVVRGASSGLKRNELFL